MKKRSFGQIPLGANPRIAYHRTFNLIRHQVPLDRYLEICEIARLRGDQTLGGSFDDAGLADTVIVWDIPEDEKEGLVRWFTNYYPSSDIVFDETGLEPVPRPDPLEPEPQPDPDIGPTNGFDNLPPALVAGLHFTAAPPPCAKRYIQIGRPSVVKGIPGGNVYEMGKLSGPETRTIWRMILDDGYYLTGDPSDRGEEMLERYKEESLIAARNLGISEVEFWSQIDYVGGTNELISNWGENTEKQVAVECEFARAVDDFFGGEVRATLLAVPVGNPSHDPADILKMLPAAKMSQDKGHLLDYHAYWTSARYPGSSYMAKEWEWIAGRWCEWDKVFLAQGVAPLYVFGESGMIVDPTDSGWVGSGLSWRDAGNILYYRSQIKEFNDYVTAWNETHGNRCLGGVLFTCEVSWGWDHFLLGNGDLLEICDWMESLQ